MNLPNSITVGRIAASPFVAWLPFIPSWGARLLAFVLFIVIAVTDYYDGKLARSRNMVTRLGALLDPLADKLLLVATFLPMFLLVGSGSALGLGAAVERFAVPDTPGPACLDAACAEVRFPFATPLGPVGLPWWVLAIVVGREAFMTLFRQAAARRGVVISAIGPAKWKTAFQWIWVGATYFWFFAATLAAAEGWTHAAWRAFALFNGTVAVVTMAIAVALTLYTVGLYLVRYGDVFTGGRGVGAR